MGRTARKRISYVLPLANSAGGHRLGVNGLAVDPTNSILYSGGRDGAICAWDLHLDLRHQDREDRDPFADSSAPDFKPPPTQFRQQVQAHTHWVNDIVLAQDYQALVSASSDITVKIWRPAAHDGLPPQTLGLHTDYVKRVVSPGPRENWVASGGLDHKISLWDLNGAGQKLQIAVGEDGDAAKGSVYALAASPSILASGGPESTVRVWDPKSGRRITKFVGHTDNVRDVLITQDGETLLTASSDQTVKVWSMVAGRCMYTLTMHNDSVWSLYSQDPQLSVFYSADRSGMVAKSDVRYVPEMDEGISVALCQEHEGINKIVAAEDHVWTATSSSSINRWNDVDTAVDVALPESYRWHRSSIATTRSRHASNAAASTPPAGEPLPNTHAPSIPFKALLRMSNTAPLPQFFSSKEADAPTMHPGITRKPSEILTPAESDGVVPCRALPEFSIEGQNGLIKHHLLNDRRRVLTLDTAGEVTLWDLISCVPIKSFGKRHLGDVEPEVNTKDTVAHWCTVDTRTGSLTCVLEPNYCFDAELYGDELDLQERIEFREDQRINLGKWVLRYLFSNLIDEEIKRDAAFLENLQKDKNVASRLNPPSRIQIPTNIINGWKDTGSGPTSGTTIRAPNGVHVPATPGMAIGLATPGIAPTSAQPGHLNALLTPTAEDGNQLEKSQTQRSSAHEPDYFSRSPINTNIITNGKPQTGAEGSQDGAAGQDANPQSPAPEDTPTTPQQKKSKALFSKKFNMTFSMKKFGSSANAEPAKPAPADDKAEDSDSRSSQADEKAALLEDSFSGALLAMRAAYEEQLERGFPRIESLVQPSLPNETPVLKPPANTIILIQEDRLDLGGVADLYEGRVGELGRAGEVDRVEQVGPRWLADVLLRNQTPIKDIVKVSFILEPHPKSNLPSISGDGNNRLNANRMLRARKVLAYVAERIEPAPVYSKSELDRLAREGKKPLKPEEYLELWCGSTLLPATQTLASIRAHVWRGGGDVLLQYRANGRKEIRHARPDADLALNDHLEGGSRSGSGRESEERGVFGERRGPGDGLLAQGGGGLGAGSIGRVSGSADREEVAQAER